MYRKRTCDLDCKQAFDQRSSCYSNLEWIIFSLIWEGSVLQFPPFLLRGFLAQRADPHHHHHQIMSLCSSSQCCFSSSSHFLVLEQRFSVCSETRPEFFLSCFETRPMRWWCIREEFFVRSRIRSFAQEEEKQQFVQFMAAFARVNRVGMNSNICTQRHAGLAPHRNSVPTTIPRDFLSGGPDFPGVSWLQSLFQMLYAFFRKKPSDLPLLFFFSSSLYVQIPMHTQSPPVSVSILLVCDTYGRTTTADPGTFFFVNDWWCEYSSLRFEDLFVFCVVLSCFCIRFSTEVCDLYSTLGAAVLQYFLFVVELFTVLLRKKWRF